jgi:hypothetical protein
LAGNPITKEFDLVGYKGNHQELWQDLYSASDDNNLEALLRRKYGFADNHLFYLINLNLHIIGHGEYSMKAVNKLLPLMQVGMKLKEAILEVYGVVDFNEVHLRNLVLEQNFMSTKALVDALVKEYEITELVLETDPLLKAGNKSRKEKAKNKRRNEKWLKENETILGDKSGYDILKYQLWEECKGICIYTGDAIPLEQLFTDAYNIDHIVPKSKLFERGYTNQVLTPKSLNEDKNRVTGIEFATQLGNKDKYLEHVELMPENKKRFLLMEEADIPDKYLSDRLDYNTKCFLTLFKGAVHIPNKLIGFYHRQWKFDHWADNDARCSLSKAFVMANMDKATVDYFDNLKATFQGKTSVGVYDLTPEIKAADTLPLIEKAIVFMPRIKYSKRTANGFYPKGQLHQETIYGQRIEKKRNAKGELVRTVYYKIRQPLGKLTPNMVSNIIDKGIQRIIQNRLQKASNHENGIAAMIEQPPLFNGLPIKSVSIRVNSDSLVPLHSSNGKGNTGSLLKYEKPVDFVQASSYYGCVLSSDEKGKLGKKGVRLIDYVRSLNNKEDIERGELILHQNDILEFEGNQYFLIGAAADAMTARPVYQLNAIETRKLTAGDYKHIKKVMVNQLSVIKATHEFTTYKKGLPKD